MSNKKIQIQFKPNQISKQVVDTQSKIRLVMKNQTTLSDPTINSSGLIDLKHYYLQTKKGHSKSSGKTLIIEVLTKLVEHTENKMQHTTGEERKKNQIRSNQFKKAIVTLQTHAYEITSGTQAKKLDGIGNGIASRIDEILKTGTLTELTENIVTDEKTQIMNELMTVTGIGESYAKKFTEMGVTGINDLIDKVGSNQVKITHHMQIGLLFYHDFQKKIPYDEIVELSKMMKSAIWNIYPNIIIEVCGSHRRKKNLSGDIDVLVSDPNIQSDEDLIKSQVHYLKNIVSHLKEVEFLIGDLTSLGNTKYMGVCQHPTIQIARHIDIRFVPYNSYHSALLYFTGSPMTNKLMRTIALEKGYTLNEYGLFRYCNGEKGEKIITSSEKHIFTILGIQYLEPEEREIN